MCQFDVYRDVHAANQGYFVVSDVKCRWACVLISLACAGVAAMIPRRLIIVAPPTHDHADGVLRMQHGLEEGVV